MKIKLNSKVHFKEISSNQKKKKKRVIKITLFFYNNYEYYPKSSNLTFSLGTPKSSHIFTTALFIIGGPQK